MHFEIGRCSNRIARLAHWVRRATSRLIYFLAGTVLDSRSGVSFSQKETEGLFHRGPLLATDKVRLEPKGDRTVERPGIMPPPADLTRCPEPTRSLQGSDEKAVASSEMQCCRICALPWNRIRRGRAAAGAVECGLEGLQQLFCHIVRNPKCDVTSTRTMKRQRYIR
jgi:hypothetical protein